MNSINPKIILALDYEHIDPLRKLVKQLSPQLCRVKVGNILFTRYGPALVEELMQQGFEVFLDLKYHDIPQTVAGACRSAAMLGVWMVNLHIVGGKAVMNAAREMIEKCSKKPLLIGVTLLTSLDDSDLNEMRMQGPIPELVSHWASLAKQHGLDGVVCSPHEISLLRQRLGKDFLLVTPGIRLSDPTQQDDQKRTMSPQEALKLGASYLVIGRPITQAKDPLAVLQQLAGIDNVK